MKKTSNKKARGGGIGVVLEHIDSKLDLVVEGQHALKAQIEHVDGEVEGLREEMNYKFETVFDELHIIRNDLKEKVGRDEFVVLEKRLTQLERKIARSRDVRQTRDARYATIRGGRQQSPGQRMPLPRVRRERNFPTRAESSPPA